MPANRDKMQSPESDGKIVDDMMKESDQKQKREHDYFFNVMTMGLRERTARAQRQKRITSAGVGGLLAVLEEEFLDLAYGSSLVSAPV